MRCAEAGLGWTKVNLGLARRALQDRQRILHDVYIVSKIAAARDPERIVRHDKSPPPLQLLTEASSFLFFQCLSLQGRGRH